MDTAVSYAEFSSQLNEKNIVILELGRSHTKCGFAGEYAPRAIIKTSITNSAGQETYLHSIKDHEELRVGLGRFIEKVYFNQLAVSPKEKKVVIVESVFCKSVFRDILTNVLFEQFNVPALLFVPDHLMALATLGRSTGVILDLGVEEAISIAVVEGVTLLDGAQFATLGSRTVDSVILNLLSEQSPSLVESLKPDVIENIRLQTCFVAPHERACKLTQNKIQKMEKLKRLGKLEEEAYILPDKIDGCPAPVEYSILGNRTITIPGTLREGVCEMFFESLGYEHSLTTMLIETILMAPIDCRRSLAENILVIGGLANLPGLEHRLAKELENVEKQERFKRKIPEKFKFHKSICPKNYVSWLGASLFCTTSSMEIRSTTREQWIKDGRKRFTEWSDLTR